MVPLISLLLEPFMAATLFQTTIISYRQPQEPDDYLLCFLSYPLESIFHSECKVNLEKCKSDAFSLVSNPLASHHRLRIRPKVIDLVYTDLHGLPAFLPGPIFYQCPHPLHSLCSRHSELLSLEQTKFIPGPQGLCTYSSLFLEINSLVTNYLPFFRALFRCHLIREEFLVHILKTASRNSYLLCTNTILSYPTQIHRSSWHMLHACF